MNIEFDSESAYGDRDKYVKTKIKMYGDRVNKNFQGKKVPKENTSKYLSLIMLNSVIRLNKKYYPQTLLEECKYVIRKNKMENLINNDHLMRVIMIMIMNVIINLIMNLIINFDNGESTD